MNFSSLTDLEIGAATLIGESESLGEQGMTETACVIQNRIKANKHWLGGNTLRGVCLEPFQFSCWLDSDDQHRILNIVNNNPMYGPYVLALGIISTMNNFGMTDITNGAVSYYDPPGDPDWAKGKTPCHTNGTRKYYNLEAILAP